MSILMLSAQDIRSVMTWDRAIDALRVGHRGERPGTDDLLIQSGPFSVFSRGVVLPGYGAGVKVCSIFPPNAQKDVPMPTEDAIFVTIGEDRKTISCILDGPEITRWKTAADSALASALLSADDSKTLLVIGAGPIALALAQAHVHVRPSIDRIMLWNRTPDRLDGLCQALAKSGRTIEVITDLNAAVSEADIISSATGTRVPLINGKFVKPGAHVDLVGGFLPDMREADDDVIAQADVFVDFRDTALVTGDIGQAIANGTLALDDIRGDLFEMVSSAPNRSGKTTVYKNAGGAHLDLLVSLAAAEAFGAS
jgi:ornithine cyclodeaminase/alanine dehydrogenase-like protein (mu-crystallin family)